MPSRSRPLAVALALLCALLAPAQAQRRGAHGLPYESDLIKGKAADLEDQLSHYSFHMEDGQTNGVIYVKEQFKENCQHPVAMKVLAYDSEPYPEITIYDSLLEIDIVRAGPLYAGRGEVDVYVNCRAVGPRVRTHAAAPARAHALPLNRVK